MDLEKKAFIFFTGLLITMGFALLVFENLQMKIDVLKSEKTPTNSPFEVIEIKTIDEAKGHVEFTVYCPNRNLTKTYAVGDLTGNGGKLWIKDGGYFEVGGMVC